MKKFKVIVPEIREEYVHVEYEVEAKDEEELNELIGSGDFFDRAKYIDSDNRYGFEVKDYEFDKAEIEEVQNA